MNKDNDYCVLSINPGSTSTKIGLFKGEKEVFKKSIEHDQKSLAEFAEISDQYTFRLEMVLEALREHDIDPNTIDAFSGRGGGLECCTSGTYEINDLMYQHAREMHTVKHPSTLGIVIAKNLAEEYGKRAFCVNPPDVDEFILEARITGIPGLYRESRIHALNQKEIALRYAKEIKKDYNNLNLIVCHIGGGISIAAHHKGRMIDCNDIVNGDGPMTPNRSGFVPAKPLIKMCFSGKYTEKELNSLINKNGGITALLGTNDMKEVSSKAQAGKLPEKSIYDAMIYQIAKQIGAMYVSLKCNCSAIILTGGMANDTYLVEKIKDYVKGIADVVVMAGEFELEALASGAIRVLSGMEQAKSYTGIPVFDGKI